MKGSHCCVIGNVLHTIILMTHREAHDSSSYRGNEGIRHFENPATAATKFLPLIAPILAVHALCNVSCQLQMLHLQPMVCSRTFL